MSFFQENYVGFQRSSSNESGENGQIYPGNLLEQYPIQNWQQDPMLDQSLLLPTDFTQYSDKHFLANPGVDEHDSKRQEKHYESEKKKPGRKPILNEPTTKRKQQNRAAQRAFRERKETHVKTLEMRVEELERQNNSQTMENQYLRAQLARLRSLDPEDSFAESMAFTFDFPPPKSFNNSSNAGVSVQAGEAIPAHSDCPSLYCSSSSNTSPQSTIEKDFNAAAMPRFPGNKSNTDSRHSSTDSGIQTMSNTNVGRSLQEPSTADDSLLFSDSFLSQPFNASFDTSTYRDTSAHLGGFDMDPLYDEADPLNFQSQFDIAQLPETLDNIAALFRATSDEETSQLTQAQLSKDEVPIQMLAPAPLTEQEAGELEAQGVTSDQQSSACPEVWRKIVAHPEFGSFDLDDLCDVFKRKNNCTETSGPASLNFKPDWDQFDTRLNDYVKANTKSPGETNITNQCNASQRTGELQKV